MPPLYLPYISPVSRPHLPRIPLYLPISPAHLGNQARTHQDKFDSMERPASESEERFALQSARPLPEPAALLDLGEVGAGETAAPGQAQGQGQGQGQCQWRSKGLNLFFVNAHLLCVPDMSYGSPGIWPLRKPQNRRGAV